MSGGANPVSSLNRAAVVPVAAITFSKMPSGVAASSVVPAGYSAICADANGNLQVIDPTGQFSPIGEETMTVTADAAIAAGQWVYVSAANHANLAKADASGTLPAFGVAPAAIGNAATGAIQTSGIYTTTGLTTGSTYYVSDATAGAITATAPTTSGHYVQPVGIALSTTQLLLLENAKAWPTAVIGASFDANAAGALNIGPTTATSIGLQQNVTVAAGKNVTMTAGAGKFDASAATGTFDSSTGTNTLNGNVTVAAAKTLTVTSGATSLTGAVGGAAALSVAGAVQTSGATGIFSVTGAASTAQTLSTEINFVNFNLAQTVQWATGNIATERAFRVQAPTLAFVGASTVTTASTVAIDGPPVAGTNATITNNPFALFIGSGDVCLAGSGANLAAAANTGFTWIPAIAAAPTGAPVGPTGAIAFCFDVTNSKLMVRTGGAWKGVAVA